MTDLDPTQRTGSFSVGVSFRPGYFVKHLQSLISGEPERQLRVLLIEIASLIQKATQGRSCIVKLKIIANVTLIDPWQAEIGEYVSPTYFAPNPSAQDQVLKVEDPDAHYRKRVFQPTPQGYQRIE